MSLDQLLKDIKSLQDTKTANDQLLKDFSDATKFLLQLKESNLKDRSENSKTVKEATTQLQQLATRLEETLSQQLQASLKTINEKLATLKPGDPGMPGEPGRDADPAAVVPLVIAELSKQDSGALEPIPPAIFRDGLESLQGDERLKAEAISGLEAIIEDIKKLKARPSGGHGMSPSGAQVYVGGAKKGRPQAINYKAGSNMTVSHSIVNGLDTVTFAASGSGGFSVIAVSGTVDDSNKTFTAASAPTLVNINGAFYPNGHGVTISGTTITTDNPIGVGGYIFAV